MLDNLDFVGELVFLACVVSLAKRVREVSNLVSFYVDNTNVNTIWQVQKGVQGNAERLGTELLE